MLSVGQLVSLLTLSLLYQVYTVDVSLLENAPCPSIKFLM